MDEIEIKIKHDKTQPQTIKERATKLYTAIYNYIYIFLYTSGDSFLDRPYYFFCKYVCVSSSIKGNK